MSADQDVLNALAAASTIFALEASGDPPDRYTLTFRGAGLARGASSHAEIGPVDRHQVDLRLPYSYPISPPDIRWLTPLWHPSVSFSGFVNLADIGLNWEADLPLDIVCERLWDIARGAFLPEKATNFAAQHWYEKQCSFQLPLDPRPLRDRALSGGSNIVRYERKSGQGVRFAGAVSSSEVIFIGDDTTAPPLPQRQPYVPIGRRRENSDVFYIGPE